MVSKQWAKWTIFEALFKTLGKLTQKIIGNTSVSSTHIFIGVFVVGLIQIGCGFLGAKKITASQKQIFLSILYGILFTVALVLTFLVFKNNGDLGINTFIVTLSIVPGALMDWKFFGKKLNKREILGVIVAITAGYVILGSPSLKEMVLLPLWVWLSFVVMILVAINQAITCGISEMDIFAFNFWGGVSVVALCGIFFLFFSENSLLSVFRLEISLKFWIATFTNGVLVVLIGIFGLKSYKNGAFIAFKKVIYNCVYLSSTIFLGILLFRESLTFGKISGVLLYCCALFFMTVDFFNFTNNKGGQHGTIRAQ